MCIRDSGADRGPTASVEQVSFDNLSVEAGAACSSASEHGVMWSARAVELVKQQVMYHTPVSAVSTVQVFLLPVHSRCKWNERRHERLRACTGTVHICVAQEHCTVQIWKSIASLLGRMATEWENGKSYIIHT